MANILSAWLPPSSFFFCFRLPYPSSANFSFCTDTLSSGCLYRSAHFDYLSVCLCVYARVDACLSLHLMLLKHLNYSVPGKAVSVYRGGGGAPLTRTTTRVGWPTSRHPLKQRLLAAVPEAETLPAGATAAMSVVFRTTDFHFSTAMLREGVRGQ